MPRAWRALAMTHCMECGISPVWAVGDAGPYGRLSVDIP